jgi:stage II sporulation protein P
MLIKILVVDDSAADRLIIKNMLSDYCILTACDGVEALQVLEEHDGINLLILDLNMPNMNGFQVLEFLKEDERFRKLRTIILTNYDESENEIKGLKLGAVDYIRKPIHMDSLKARIDVHVALLHAEEALERKLDEQLLTIDMILDQAPIGIAISHSCDGKYANEAMVRINPVYEQITGRTKEELIKSGWAKITHPDDLEKEMENFRKLKAGEIKSFSMEKRFIKPDGSFIWVYLVSAALAPLKNKCFNHISLIKDISDRKQIENALRYITEHDRLTGLFNRDYLKAQIINDINQKKGLKRALVGINLSTVQLLTANFGFLYTQNLIKKVAEALGQYCTDNRFLFHTHSDESYIPTSGTASEPGKGDVLDIGKALQSALQKEGISVTHSDKLHDPHDINAYHRSRRTAAQLIKEQPDAVFDIHRDSAPARAYQTSINGVDSARIMIVIGRSNPNMQTNLQYAKRIKAAADELYPGLMRGIFMGKGDYNQDLYPTSILFECGTDRLSKEDAIIAVHSLSDAIVKVLRDK